MVSVWNKMVVTVPEVFIGTHTDGFWPHQSDNAKAIPVPGGVAGDNLLIAYGYSKLMRRMIWVGDQAMRISCTSI
jgi:hypothetical protein